MGLGLLSLVVGAVVVEGILRLTLPQPMVIASPPGLAELDPPRRYRLAPGYRGTISSTHFSTSVSINSLGLRGPEVGTKAPGTFRILILGDSYSFGWGVEEHETIAVRLQDVLREINPMIETLNGSVPGYGVKDEFDWLEQYGLALEPDLVVLAICLGNDLLDATADRRRETIRFEFPEMGTTKGLRYWLFFHSHFVRLAERSGLAQKIGVPESWVRIYLRDALQGYAKEPPALALEGRAATRGALQRLAELSDRHRIPLAAILIPPLWNIDPAQFEWICGWVGLDPDAHSPDVPAQFFKEALREFGIPVIDLSPQSREAMQRGDSLYLQADPHWSAHGHLLGAQALRNLLLRENLLPPPTGEPAP